MAKLNSSALFLAGAIGLIPMTGTDKTAKTDIPTSVSVRQVVTMQALVGETVTVTGSCLDKHAPAVAIGSRPYSGVWQLEDHGVATWVLGPMPASCSTGSATVTAKVVQDNLPLFSAPRMRRQYLVTR